MVNPIKWWADAINKTSFHPKDILKFYLVQTDQPWWLRGILGVYFLAMISLIIIGIGGMMGFVNIIDLIF